MSRTRWFYDCLFAMTVAAGVLAQQPGAPLNPAPVPLSEADTAPNIIHREAPVYPPLARASRIEGMVVLSAVVAKDGSIAGLQTISGHPLLVRAALEAVSKWRYEPTVIDGQPVEVATRITVTFKLDDLPKTAAAKAAPATVVDSGTGPATIHLKNGRVIHADTASAAGDKIEYTIGESIYEIPQNLVQEIVHAANAPPSPPQATSVSDSNVVTAPALSKMPIAYGEDPKNWYMFESTEQLRDECQSGQFKARLHPEFQSKSVFPVSDQEAQMTCASLAANMDSDYERLIDRGVELEKILCTAGHGSISTVRSNDPALAANQEELGRITVDLNKRMTDALHQQPVDRAKGMRMMLDFYRIAGTCGHGM